MVVANINKHIIMGQNEVPILQKKNIHHALEISLNANLCIVVINVTKTRC